MKLLKVVQSQVELIRISFKFEAPIPQVQIITYMIYLSITEMLTYFHMILVLPIDKENPYRLSRWYIHMSSSWHDILAISPTVYRNLSGGR